MCKKTTVKEIEFNNFLCWYFSADIKLAIKYFEEELGINVKPFIGNKVFMRETIIDGQIMYNIDGTEFDVDAISSYFDYLNRQ